MRPSARQTAVAATLAFCLVGAIVASTPAFGRPNGAGGAARTGNFVSACPYSHSAPDDPIVFPGQPGASHAHDFFANITTDAGSTLESLQAGRTLCNRPGDEAAYWVPTLSDGGEVVRPTRVLAYYLVAGRDATSIEPFPVGLKVVTDRNAGVVRWACIGGGQDTPEQSGTLEQAGPPDCPAGTHLVQRIHVPDCWNGHDLDSADHRSHMAYAVAGAGAGRRACPATHPVAVPHLRLGVHYPDGVGGADVTLSSGGPETSHADFFNAWDPAVQARLVRQCLNAAKTCGATGP